MDLRICKLFPLLTYRGCNQPQVVSSAVFKLLARLNHLLCRSETNLVCEAAGLSYPLATQLLGKYGGDPATALDAFFGGIVDAQVSHVCQQLSVGALKPVLQTLAGELPSIIVGRRARVLPDAVAGA